MQCVRKNCRNLAVDGANYCNAHLQREGLARPGINLTQRSGSTRDSGSIKDSGRQPAGDSGKRSEARVPGEPKSTGNSPADSRKK
jgi:hypothetical protein